MLPWLSGSPSRPRSTGEGSGGGSAEHGSGVSSYLFSRPASALFGSRSPKISVHFSRARSASVSKLPAQPLVPLSKIKEVDVGEDGTAHMTEEAVDNFVSEEALVQQAKRRHRLMSRKKKLPLSSEELHGGTRSSTPEASSSSLSDLAGGLPGAAHHEEYDDEDDAAEYDVSDDMSASGRSELSQFSHLAAWGDPSAANLDDVRRRHKLVRAQAVIKRHARRKAAAAQRKAAAAGHKIVHPKKQVIQSREAAQAVIANNLMKWRERRLQRKAKHDAKHEARQERHEARQADRAEGLHSDKGRSRSFSRRSRKVAAKEAAREAAAAGAGAEKKSRSPNARAVGEGAGGGSSLSRSPKIRATPGDVPLAAALEGSPGSSHNVGGPLFEPEEFDLGRQLIQNFGTAPIDKPQAVLVCDRSELRVWKWKAPPDASGNVIDVYESEFEVPVSVESFMSMQMELATRTLWDATTKVAKAVMVEGPTLLTHLHGFEGDYHHVYWLVEAPWPLKNREYLLRRRVAVVPPGPANKDGDDAASSSYGAASASSSSSSLPAEGGFPEALMRKDILQDPEVAARWHPTIPSKTLRVTTHEHTQVAWSAISASGVRTTRVRSRCVEDPMMPIPKWFLSMLMDKMMPRTIKSMVKVAVELDQKKKRQAQQL